MQDLGDVLALNHRNDAIGNGRPPLDLSIDPASNHRAPLEHFPALDRESETRMVEAAEKG